MIDDLSQGPFLQSEDGRRSFTVYATVRYEVDGTLAQGRIALSGCGRGGCPASRQRGDTITVAANGAQESRLNGLDVILLGGKPILDLHGEIVILRHILSTRAT